MKNKYLHFLLLLMAIISAQFTIAQTFNAIAPTGQSIRYSINNGYAQVTGNQSWYGSNLSGHLTIPSTVINPNTSVSYSVTAINSYAFEYCSGLLSITVPNSVTSIGNGAFYDIPNVYYTGTATGKPWGASMMNDTCMLVDGLFAIENTDSALTLHITAQYTGAYNSGYNSINTKINKIKSRISQIEVDAANTNFASEDGVLYNRQKTQLLLVPQLKSGNMTIGHTVTTIGREALYNCNLIDTIFLNAYDCKPENKSYNSFYDIYNAATHANVLIVGDEVVTLSYQLLNIPDLTTINVDPDNWDHHSVDGMLASSNTLIFCPRGRSGEMTLPTGITRIKDSAFMDCTALTGINLQGVHFIGQDAFRNCTGFSSLIIPTTVDSLCSRAFKNCSFDSLYFNAPNAHTYQYTYGYISGVGNRYAYFPTEDAELFSTDSLRVVLFGSNVQDIPAGAFSDCHNLTTISIPTVVRSIRGYTFKGCTSLTAIVLPDSVFKIDQRAFYGCSSLATINWPSSLDTIGKNAFENCSSLTLVQLPDSLHTIMDGAFNGCSLLRKINIPMAANYIGKSNPILKDCPTLDTVLYNAVSNVKVTEYSSYYGISCDVTSLFYGSSESTTKVKHLIVGEGVRSMPSIWGSCVDTLTLPSTLDTVLGAAGTNMSNTDLKQVNFNCKNLAFIVPERADYHTISLSNESNSGLFSNAANLRHVFLGDSVQSIPAYCFRGCHNVHEIVHLQIPASITSIGTGAFYGCTQIQDAVIPQTVEQIGLFPFTGCSNLRKINFNSINATETEEYYLPASRDYAKGALAYDNIAHATHPENYVKLSDMMPHFDTIVIGSGVKSITAGLFGRVFDKVLDSIGFNQPVKIINNSTVLRRIGKAAFANLQITEFDFIDSLREIESGAFMNCHHLTKIVLPEGLESLGDVVFVGCSNLDSVSLPSTLALIGTDCFRNSPLSYLYFNCRELQPVSFELPMNQIRCGQQCFGGTENLKTIDFGPDVETLGTGIFSNANGLTHIELPEGLSYIGERAFCMYSSYYPEDNSVHNETQNTAYTFGNLKDAPKVVIQGSGFYGSEIDSIRLKNIVLPSTLEFIGNYAFTTGICRSTYSSAIHTREWILDTIACRAVIPPEFGNNTSSSSATSPSVFRPSTFDSTMLIIPCGSRSAYENYSTGFINSSNNYVAYTEGLWGDFAHITEQATFDIVLTVNVDSMGSATYSCTTPSGNLTGVILSATPADNHHFVQWNDGITSNPRTVYLGSDTAFQAQFAWGNLYQVTAYSSNNSRGSVTGSGTFVQNTVDTLIATPVYGYHFTSWNDGDTTNPRLLTVTSNVTLTATFQPNQYTLSVFSADSTQGSVSGAGSYTYNTNHPISASPSTGYHFTQWNDGVSTNPRSVKVQSDTSFTASFAINVYTLSVTTANATMGSATANASEYNHGDTAILTATANYGYHFSSWNDGDTTNPRHYCMTQNNSLTASFAPNLYYVATSCDATHGTVSGSGQYSYLSDATITATPATGYHFSTWSDGDNTNPRTLQVVTDTLLEAFFAPNQYSIQILSNDAAMGNTYGSGIYSYLDTVHYGIASTQSHHHFVQWSDGSTDSTGILVVYSDQTVTASFAIDQYTITVNPNNNSHGSVYGGGNYSYGSYATLSASPSSGYYFVQWNNGVTDNPYFLYVDGDTTITAIFAPTLEANLYMVSVENEHNTLTWESEQTAVSYQIFREGSVAGSYECVAELEAGGILSWTDTNSRPETRSYSYYLQATDDWGTTFTGSTHKTMHLSITYGGGNSRRLEWSEYIGTQYATCIIYRGTTPSNLEEFDRIPAGYNNTYTDANLPSGEVYYQVGIVPATQMTVGAESDDVIRSNIANGSNVGIEKSVDENITVFATTEGITILCAQGKTVCIYSIDGHLMTHLVPSSDTFTISLPTGAYIVKINNLSPHKAIVLK